MNKSVLAAVIRHVLGAMGAVGTADGLASDAEIQSAIGAAMTLGAILWSVYEKIAARRASAASANVPKQPQPPTPASPQ